MADLVRDRPRRPSVGSLNTWGPGARVVERYVAIAEGFEAAGVEVVNVQEVHTYFHLGLLTRHMSSYRYVSYRRSVVGPAGGLVTLSRIPFSATKYERFPMPSATITTGLPPFSRLRASVKGALVTRLDDPRIYVVNTHLLANFDGDWSEANRYHSVHQSQLAALARTIGSLTEPSIITGDFNIARESTLLGDFLASNQLVDAFGGECPPTFHAEHLDPGSTPHCIDLILSTGSPITIESATMLFTDKQPMPHGNGYVSDHLGLCVRVRI
jgi:endonuclease/exonuclease/phosphatase family metal-dependent hydrolase